VQRTYLFLMSFLIAACGNGHNGPEALGQKSADELNSADQPDVVTESRALQVTKSRKVVLEADLKNLSEFKTHINDYQVSFRALTGNYLTASVICTKKAFDPEKLVVTSQFDARGQLARVNLSIPGNGPSELVYRCSVQDRGTEIDAAEITLFKSIILEGEKNYAFVGSNKIETLLIEEGSVLVTKDQDVSLNMVDLISLGGTIATFPERFSDTTQPDYDGLSGGKIVLVTKKAMGELAVELRGLNGGKRTIVPAPNLLVPPQPAKRSCGVYAPRNVSLCHGLPGVKGFPGEPGLRGLNGGATGSLLLHAESAEQFQLMVNHFPGQGTAGGQGGAGGKGGQGGQGATTKVPDYGYPYGGAGRMSVLVDISSVINHPNGAPGPEGDRGQPGIPGVAGEILSSLLLLGPDKLEIKENWKNF
jgi:hypothetical protein